jgi:hypothetical protein
MILPRIGSEFSMPIQRNFGKPDLGSASLCHLRALVTPSRYCRSNAQVAIAVGQNFEFNGSMIGPRKRFQSRIPYATSANQFRSADPQAKVMVWASSCR